LLLMRLGFVVEETFWQSRYWLSDSLWNLKKFLWQPGVIVTAVLSTSIDYLAFRPSPTRLGGMEVFSLFFIWSVTFVSIYFFGYFMYRGGEHWPSMGYSKPKVPSPPEPEVDEFPSPDEVDEFVRRLPLKK